MIRQKRIFSRLFYLDVVLLCCFIVLQMGTVPYRTAPLPFCFQNAAHTLSRRLLFSALLLVLPRSGRGSNQHFPLRGSCALNTDLPTGCVFLVHGSAKCKKNAI